MHIYKSIQLISLLIAGLTLNSPKFGSPSATLKQTDPVQQHLLAEASDKGCGDSDSSDSGQSDSRGSERRDKQATQGAESGYGQNLGMYCSLKRHFVKLSQIQLKSESLGAGIREHQKHDPYFMLRQRGLILLPKSHHALSCKQLDQLDELIHQTLLMIQETCMREPQPND